MYTYVIKNSRINLFAMSLLVVNSFLQVIAATKMTDVANNLIEKNLDGFVYSLLFVLFLWGISFFISYFQRILQEKAIQKMSTQIRHDLSLKFSYLDNPVLVEENKKKIVSFMQNDINLIEDKGFRSLYSMIRFISNAVFSLIALLYFNIYLFFIAIILAFVLNVIPRMIRKITRSGNKKISDANNLFLNYLQDIVTGYSIIKSFNAEKLFYKTIDEGSSIVQEAKIFNARSQSIVTTVVSVLNILSQIIIIFTTGMLVILGRIPVGAVLSTTELATKIFDSLSFINQYYILIDSILPLFSDLTPNNPSNRKQSSKFKYIYINNMSFRYSEKTKAIFNNLTISINKGTKYSIVGNTGVGKSTLLKLILKELTPTSGKITLNGNNYTKQDILQFSSYLQQDSHIFNFSLDENITLGRDTSPQKLQEVKDILNIGNLDIKHLSGGEKQLVSIARVLIDPKPLIIFDESFSNLDIDTARKVIKIFSDLPDLTIIFISHRMDELSNIKVETISLT